MKQEKINQEARRIVKLFKGDRQIALIHVDEMIRHVPFEWIRYWHAVKQSIQNIKQ